MLPTQRTFFAALVLVFAVSLVPTPVHADDIDTGAGGFCDDGNACNDGNACTIDSCNGASCTHVPVPDPGPTGGTPCNAGSGNCTTSGWCFSGQCSAQPISCNDGNACTLDGCTLSGSCWHGSAINPQPIGNLVFSADRLNFSWERPPAPCGPFRYYAAAGTLADLPVGSHPELERCIVATTTTAQDTLVPAIGEGFWYDVRAAYHDGILTPPVIYGPFGRQRINGVESYRQTDSCP